MVKIFLFSLILIYIRTEYINLVFQSDPYFSDFVRNGISIQLYTYYTYYEPYYDIILVDLEINEAISSFSSFFSCDSDSRLADVLLIDLSFIQSYASSVTTMDSMFKSCTLLESIDFTNFNTPLVTTMNGMFEGCTSLKSLNLAGFDTSSVEDMGRIFYDCQSLEFLDIGNFDMSRIATNDDMFYNIAQIKYLNIYNIKNPKGLDSLVTPQVVCQKTVMINGAKNECCYFYDDIKDCTNYITMVYDTCEYCYDSSIDSCTEGDTDGGADGGVDGGAEVGIDGGINSGTGFNIEQLNWPNIAIIINVAKKSLVNKNFVPEPDECLAVYEIYFSSPVTSLDNLLKGNRCVLSIDFSHFDSSSINSMNYMFCGSTSLRSIDFTNFITSKVTGMTRLFKNCNSLNILDVSHFNTSLITSFESMFSGCNQLHAIDTSNFKTNLVTDMKYMFEGCALLKSIDVSSFNTNQVTNMEYMFSGCSELISIDTSNFITNQVTKMSHMFFECMKLTSLNLSNFETSQVTTMDHMFCDCQELTSLNLSNFITPQLTNMESMFEGCSQLRIALLNNFILSNVNSMNSLFKGCYNIKILNMGLSDFKEGVTAEDIFYNFGNFSMIYCLNKDSAPEEITLRLTEFPYFFCSDTCYYREDNVIIPAENKCIDDCTNDDLYKTESNHKCYISDITIKSDYVAEDYFSSEFSGHKPQCFQSEENTIIKCPFNVEYTSLENMFRNVEHIQGVDLSNLNSSKVTSLSYMFSECINLQYIIFGNFDTNKVTDMSHMFDGCSQLTSIDLNTFNTNIVTNMEYMFQGCSRLQSLDLGHFNTNQLTNMESMFNECSGLVSINLNNFNTNQVTNMANLFRGCSELLSLDLTNFITTQVTDMGYMFSDCSQLISLDVSNFNTPQLTNMQFMFQGCSNIRVLLLNNFITSNVDSMESLFQDCFNLKLLNIEKFIFKESVTTDNMFTSCNETMIFCIDKENAPEQIISDLENYPNFYCSETCYVREDNKIIPANNECTDDCLLGTYILEYNDKCYFSEIIISSESTEENYFYSEYGEIPECINTGVNEYRCLIKNEITSLANMFKDKTNLMSLDLSVLDSSKVTSMSYMFSGCSYLYYVNFNGFDTSQLTDISYIFNDCVQLTSIDLEYFNTSQVTNMEGMFQGCVLIVTIDLSNFTTNQIKNIGSMFNGCNRLESIDLSSFVTNQVQNMSFIFKGCTNLITVNLANLVTTQLLEIQGMFYECNQLTSIDLSNFLTNKVTNMHSMFYGCSQLALLNININNFNGNQVKYMQYMFYGCSQLTSIDFSNFQASQLINIEYMFYGCSGLLSLNLNKFGTTKVTSTQYMFYGCNQLISLDLSNFNTPQLTNMESMFQGCSNLKILLLNNFITSNVNSMNSLFYGCSNLKLLNMEKFTFKSSVSSSNMFSSCNSSMIFCIDRDSAPSGVQSQLSNYPNLYCSDTCFVREDNKLVPCDKACIDDCTKHEKYIYEHNHICFYDDTYEEKCRDKMTHLPENILESSSEEVFKYLDDLVKIADPTKSFLISGEDSMVIIKPLNAKVESSVNIDFSKCEEILKEKFPGKEFRVLQMNMKNEAANNAVDQVEYKIYDQYGEEIDLSVLSGVTVTIEYKIKNTSLLDLGKVSDFQDKGVDAFNLKDDFFNDICYPYTDENSSCDMVLTDRVSDIFQNVSLCGEGCEYTSFDLETNSSKCECEIKTEATTEKEQGNFQTYLMGAFFDSNFGAIKCYNLVFTFEGKLSNVGFWVFGSMLILHIPLYVFYFLKGTSKLQNFILKEMDENGYNTNQSTEKKFDKKKNNKIANLETEDNILAVRTGKENNPPKKSIKNNNQESQKSDMKEALQLINLKLKNVKLKMKSNQVNKVKIFTKNAVQLKNSQNFITINPEEEKASKYINATKNNRAKMRNFNFGDKNYSLNINSSEPMNVNEYQKNKKVVDPYISKKEEERKPRLNLKNTYSLIMRNLNQKGSPKPFQSDYVIDNFDFEEAIIYENRSYCRIFFIILIAKENVLNMIFFDPPLELKPIRFAIFIFNFAMDYAFNALFYLTDNISDKYHYEGAYAELYSIINNLPISITSTAVSFALMLFFETLTQSTKKIESLFREQEELLKNDKDYKVTTQTKLEIRKKIKEIVSCLNIKIKIFIVVEFLIMLFFFYYVTAFCQIYKNTQVSWILDCLVSYIMSLGITIGFSIVFAFFYKIAVIYKISLLYKLIFLLL